MFPDTKGQNPYAPLVTDKRGNAVMAGGSPITVNSPPMKQSDPLAKAQQMHGMASIVDDKLGLGVGEAFDASMKGIGASAKQALMGSSANAAQAKGLMDVAATSAGGTLSPLGAQAVLGPGAAAAQAAGTTGATLAGTAAGGAKGGAPIAAALGPIGIPLLIGGALYAASR